MKPGRHNIRFDYPVDEPSLGKSGKGILLWPAVIAHLILTALLARAHISTKKPG